MAKCDNCLKVDVCKYNDGINLYCKEDYICPHFKNKTNIEAVHYGEWVYCWQDVKRCSCCGYEVSFVQADIYQGCPVCRSKMKRGGKDA